MPFQKGHTHSPGRTKGSKNKLTKEIREVLTTTLEGELENIQALLDQLEPKDRIDAIAKLMPYVAPKLTSQTINIDAEVTIPKRPKWMQDGDEETKHLYN